MLFRRSLFIATTAMLCSPFDADAFLSQTQEGALETVVPVAPTGDYRAVIDEIIGGESGNFRTVVGGEKAKPENQGKEFTIFTPVFVLQDDPRLAEVSQFYDGKPVKVRHKGIFLDLTDSGGLDFSKGKNVDLGRLQEAVGQLNMPGWTFKHLEGAGPLMVKVDHESDKGDDTKKYARVVKTVKIS
jgi:hypothetical protein